MKKTLQTTTNWADRGDSTGRNYGMARQIEQLPSFRLTKLKASMGKLLQLKTLPKQGKQKEAREKLKRSVMCERRQNKEFPQVQLLEKNGIKQDKSAAHKKRLS